MLHKEFWGLLFLAFVGWIFVASSPNDRIEHFCRPVQWSGNVSTSIAALIVPSQQTTVQTWFDKFEYGCQYMTWRLLYQADYNKAMGLGAPDKKVSKEPAPQEGAAPASAAGSASTAPVPASSEKAAK